MSREIVTYSGSDKKLVLANAEAARIIAIGTGWNSIRIGMRYSFTSTTAPASSPLFFLGMTSNPSGTPLSNGVLSGSSTPFAVGTATMSASWTNSGSYYSTTVKSFYKIGSTITYDGVSAGTDRVAIGVPERRMIEIIKGSPNYTISCWNNGGSASLSRTYDDLIAVMMAGTIAGYTKQNRTLAIEGFEDTYGPLNAITVGWNRPVPDLSIYEVTYMILS